MDKNRYTVRLFGWELGMVALALLFLAPFYFVLANSFKSYGEILLDSASLPEVLRWENFRKAWETLDFPLRLTNNLLLAILSDIALVFVSATAAYRLIRSRTRTNRVLFYLFVAAMVVPFQAIMIPLIKVAYWFDLLNSIPGAVVVYLGLGVSLNVFLFQGFVRSVPLEIEEAARVDGCTPYGVFWRIVFPLLKPMTITTVLLNTLWIWNDFLISLIILQDPKLRTIQVAINSLFAEYTNQWDLALAALTISVVPLLLFFLVLQRHIIEGISAGAVKG